MSNEKKIIDKIIADAEEEKKKILDAAKAQADAIIAKAEDAAERDVLAAREEALTEAEKASAKVISGALMDAKKAVLTAKQECLGQVVAKANEKLLSMSGSDYEEVILNMLSKAEKGEVLLSAKNKKELEKRLTAEGYQVSDEVRDISGGFIIKNGDIEYNYSFEAIMMVEKEQIEQLAAEILFK